VNSTCPVCHQTASYPDNYAYKWHRCKAGCVAVGTRLFVVPDSVAELEGEASQAHPRWVAILPALALGLPFLAQPGGAAWVLTLAVAGVGAAMAAALWQGRTEADPLAG
jgi:hypothetical protein